MGQYVNWELFLQDDDYYESDDVGYDDDGKIDIEYDDKNDIE